MNFLDMDKVIGDGSQAVKVKGKLEEIAIKLNDEEERVNNFICF